MRAPSFSANTYGGQWRLLRRRRTVTTFLGEGLRMTPRYKDGSSIRQSRPARFAIALAVVLAASVAGVPAAKAAPADKPDQSATSGADPQSIEGIDAKTLATMRRQEALQPAVQALWDEQVRSPQSGFAGVVFEGDGLSLYWKGDLTSAMATAVTSARRAGPVAVKPAPFSAAELQAAGEKINKKIREHGATDIQTVGSAPEGTGIHVARQPDATRAAIAAVRARHGKAPVVPAERMVAEADVGVPVTVSTAATPLIPATTRTTDVSPWNGGGRWTNASKGDLCTTGFGVHSYGHSYVLTAAHCASDGDRLTAAGTNMGPVYYDDWSYDILLINAPGWHVIFDGTSTTSVTKNVNSWGYWAKNELVCQSGATSGTICGLKQIESTDVYWPQSNPDSDGDWGYTVHGLIKTTQVNGQTAVRGGDSGGPVFSLDGAGVRAKGTVSAGSGTTMYFQDWATVLSRFAAYPNTTGTTS